MSMSAEVQSESRTIRIHLTDAPDMPNWTGKYQLAPQSINITYRWTAPAHRSSWYRPEIANVEVLCLRRLKSGGVGTASETVTLYRSGDWPTWVTTLVVAHMPQGWDQ